MIKANELRKGSKILMSGEVQTVEAILWDDYISCIPFDAERTVDQFDPIPLTPEILEKVKKAGFEHVMEDVHEIASGVFAYNFWTKEIRYLHQLQNLIFVITGQELEINL